MKNKNRRELEKYWAEQAAKKAKTAKKKQAGDANKTAQDTSTNSAESTEEK